MASITGKGKRKVKGKTLDLNTFLGEDQDAPAGFSLVTPRRIDWADAMENEEMDDRYTLDFHKEDKVILPTAPKSARGPDIDLNRVPNKPPFTAYLGNLPYDVSEDDIIHFFRHLQVSNVRLPREGGDRGRLRGFGYAEFNNRQALIESLSLNNETLKNRPIKVSLAGESDNDREKRDDRSDRMANDWRSGRKEPPPSSRNDAFRNDGFSQGRGMSYTDRYRYQKNNRPAYSSEQTFMRDRPENNYRRPVAPTSSYENNIDKTESDSTQSNDRWSQNRKKDFQPTSGPKERQKLQLKPRTKPVDSSIAASEATTNSAIFGGARPVDTAAREREIEERLARERDESAYNDQKERSGSGSTRLRKLSTSSKYSNRSRKSSESLYGSHPNSFSEDECLPPPKSLLSPQYFPETHQPTTLPRIKPRQNIVRTSNDHVMLNNTKLILTNNRSAESFEQRPSPGVLESSGKKLLQRQRSQPDEKLDGFFPANKYVSNQQSHSSLGKHPMQQERPRPPVYTTVNKFSHLPTDADDFHEANTSD